jgi:hypothetical protein
MYILIKTVKYIKCLIKNSTTRDHTHNNLIYLIHSHNKNRKINNQNNHKHNLIYNKK